MVYTPVPTRGGPAPRIAVFGIWAGAFDPIAGGPERIAAARGPGSVRSGSRSGVSAQRLAANGSRQTVRGLTFTGQCCAVDSQRINYQLSIVPG
jgi:hypothetical protein